MTPRAFKIIPCALALALVGCSDSTNPLAQETLDTVPPAAPANVDLNARAQFDPQLQISWDANAEADLAGYVVHRSLDDGGTWVTATELITSTEFIDDYYSVALYRVIAVDLAENESAYSTLVSYLAPTGGPKLPANSVGQNY